MRDLSDEKKRIHVVKHLPRSDEELLDNLIAKHVEQKVPVKKAQKDARTELN